MPKEAFLVLVAVYAILDGMFLIYSVRHGSWLGAMGAALLASTVPIGLLASFYEDPRVVEDRSVGHLLRNFQDQSYAFLFGDAFFLTFAAAMAALAWKHAPELKGTWATSWWWTGVSVIAGMSAAAAFRYLMDKASYAAAMGAFWAPTKLLHDFCAYVVLFGGLFCVGVPLFVRTIDSRAPFVHLYAAPYLALVLAGIFLWAVAGVAHDAGNKLNVPFLNRMGLFTGVPLNPSDLHPNDWVWPEVSIWRWLRGLVG